MSNQLKFSDDTITDQKRLVRGEQYLLARSILRKRDETHHARWRVMTMAGGSPKGEIVAIRELMPKAHILAVDKDDRCLEAAINAGADDVVACDICAYSEQKGEVIRYPNGYESTPRPQLAPPLVLSSQDRFDIVCLDLCGTVTPALKQCVGIYLRHMVLPGGVFILTFSYGRDVVEMFTPERSWESGPSRQSETHSFPDEVPDAIVGRIAYLFPAATSLDMVRSIMVYRGAEMPMCSLLLQKGRLSRGPISFVKVEQGDFELAVAYPNSANLYDCPQERIDSLRRQFAAIKASLTRIEKARSPLLFDPEDGKSR